MSNDLSQDVSQDVSHDLRGDLGRDGSHDGKVPGAIHVPGERREWHRRLALGLSAQLPDDAQDARAVVACVEELIETFLYPRPAAAVPQIGGARQDRVLAFAGVPGGISSCRTR
jgi:hypothetical protein